LQHLDCAHRSPGDIDAVIGDGKAVEQYRTLLPAVFDELGRKVTRSSRTGWKAIVAEMLQRSAEIDKKVDPIDWGIADKTTGHRLKADQTASWTVCKDYYSASAS